MLDNITSSYEINKNLKLSEMWRIHISRNFRNFEKRVVSNKDSIEVDLKKNTIPAENCRENRGLACDKLIGIISVTICGNDYLIHLSIYDSADSATPSEKRELRRKILIDRRLFIVRFISTDTLRPLVHSSTNLTSNFFDTNRPRVVNNFEGKFLHQRKVNCIWYQLCFYVHIERLIFDYVIETKN